MSEPALIERDDGFDYDLRMLCGCGLSSPLSAATYEEGANHSRMTCVHCGAGIHYGPAVATIRDPDDPALDDEALGTFAWYHTSTQPDWPSPTFSADFVDGLDDDDLLMPSRDAFIAEHTSKALHVGTYEAAIENMLRRMNDELDSHSQFYLYRVELNLDPGKINPGFRDENHEVASDVSISELAEHDLSAVRYLNVHEAIGTLSLAVAPHAIRAVQRISLPVLGLTMPAGASDDRFLREVADAARRVSDAAGELDATPIERRKMELGMLPDPTGGARRHRDAQRAYSDAIRRLERRLEDQCLPHASALVRRAFTRAVAHWQVDGTEQYVSRYRSLAALLERPAQVRADVGGEPWRQV